MIKTATPVTDRLVARLIGRGQGCEKNARQVLTVCLFGDSQSRKPFSAGVVAHSLRYHNASTSARCEGDAQALITESAHWPR